MNVAVLSLTRDRLAYTQHCFSSLRALAGCDYDHYVLDQGSTDGTDSWLLDGTYAGLHLLKENIGISRGHNLMLEQIASQGYDVVATFDNDCELEQEGTLRVCAEIAAKGEWIVSPTVQGLNYPPCPGQTYEYNGETIGAFQEMGGIFRVMPGEFARTFRFSEDNPLWGHDERDVGRVAAERGVNSGYLLNWHVNHYETTQGQSERYPDYFARKLAEMR